MAVDFQTSADFGSVADGLAPVTFRRRASPESTFVPRALRHAMRSQEAAASAGRYTTSDAVWHLAEADLPTVPQPGDQLIDASGQCWTILDVRQTTGAGRWRCVGRNLAVAHGLDQYVDIEKATYTKGSSGAEEPAWQLWRSGVRAKVQPAKREVRTQHHHAGAPARFTIFLAEDLPLDHTHRIRAPDGTRFRIVAVRNASRIDALPEVEAVQEPGE